MINLYPYRSLWRAEFKKAGNAIRRGLGDVVLRIDHIGSTSVPDLCAKDVIDIQITVTTMGVDVIERLEELGYAHRSEILADHVPPGYDCGNEEWAKLLFAEAAGDRRLHIYVREAGRANQRFALLFRDYLVAHPHAASAYGDLKRRLAAELVNDDAYADVKDPAVDLIYYAAEAWARQSSRHQPPSDACTMQCQIQLAAPGQPQTL